MRPHHRLSVDVFSYLRSELAIRSSWRPRCSKSRSANRSKRHEHFRIQHGLEHTHAKPKNNNVIIDQQKARAFSLSTAPPTGSQHSGTLPGPKEKILRHAQTLHTYMVLGLPRQNVIGMQISHLGHLEGQYESHFEGEQEGQRECHLQGHLECHLECHVKCHLECRLEGHLEGH